MAAVTRLRLLLATLRFGLGWLFTLVMGTLAVVLSLPLGGARAWTLCARRWGRSLLWLGRIRLDVEGAEHMDQPAVFIVNHQSLIDGIFVPALLPETTRYVAKRELARVPFFGWGLKATGNIMIDRSRTQSAIHAIQEGLRHLPRGWSVVVFPEGTRSKTGELQPFKKGAFQIAIELGVPIVPLGAVGQRDIVPQGAVVIRPGTIYVTIGAPLSTKGWTHDTLAEHIAEARAAVERCIERSDRRRAAAQATLGAPSGPRAQRV